MAIETIQKQCTIVRYAAVICRNCADYVPEDCHVIERTSGEGELAVYCGRCCPEHRHPALARDE